MALSDITNQLNLNVSEDTLCRELANLGLNHRIAKRKPNLNEKQGKRHLSFALKYKHWGFEEWSRLIWTDEMGAQAALNDKVWIWRTTKEAYNPNCISSTFFIGFWKLKFWGAVHFGKKSKAVVLEKDGGQMCAEEYLSEIFDKEPFDFWQDAMEDKGQLEVLVTEDGVPYHCSVVNQRREELKEFGWDGWGPGVWPPILQILILLKMFGTFLIPISARGSLGLLQLRVLWLH